MESATKAQLSKVTVQCFTVLTMLQNINKKNDSVTFIIKRLLTEIKSPSLNRLLGGTGITYFYTVLHSTHIRQTHVRTE